MITDGIAKLKVGTLVRVVYYMTCPIVVHHTEKYLDHRFSFCRLMHRILQGPAYFHGTCGRPWQEQKWMFLL